MVIGRILIIVDMICVTLLEQLDTGSVSDRNVCVQIGGVCTTELHELELFAVQQLEYKLCVSPDEVATRLRELKVLAHSRATVPNEAGIPISGPTPLACRAGVTDAHHFCA